VINQRHTNTAHLLVAPSLLAILPTTFRTPLVSRKQTDDDDVRQSRWTSYHEDPGRR